MNYFVDIIALIVILHSLFRGMQRGLLLAFLNVCSVICSYVAAILFSAPLGELLEDIFDIGHIFAVVLGGFGSFLIVSVVFSLVIRHFKIKRKDADVSELRRGILQLDRISGGVLGLCTGMIMIALFCWSYEMFQVGAFGKNLPDISGSFGARVSRVLIDRGAYYAVKTQVQDETTAKKLSSLISSPGETVEGLRDLTNEPKMQTLFSSKQFASDLLSGDTKKIGGNPDLCRVLNDEGVMQKAHDMGLVASDFKEDDFKDELSTRLAGLGGKVEKVLNEPDVEKVIKELEKEGLLENPDPARLMQDKRFSSLVFRVLNADKPKEK
ncbi:MAG: CvpA family protein [Kiritimatiellae bacterium]|jgi:uncharacterized membrane protein required for colicin V production|nr:CvpA family protein [Kiritimatiellia bacterium]